MATALQGEAIRSDALDVLAKSNQTLNELEELLSSSRRLSFTLAREPVKGVPQQTVIEEEESEEEESEVEESDEDVEPEPRQPVCIARNLSRRASITLQPKTFDLLGSLGSAPRTPPLQHPAGGPQLQRQGSKGSWGNKVKDKLFGWLKRGDADDDDPGATDFQIQSAGSPVLQSHSSALVPTSRQGSITHPISHSFSQSADYTSVTSPGSSGRRLSATQLSRRGLETSSVGSTGSHTISTPELRLPLTSLERRKSLAGRSKVVAPPDAGKVGVLAAAPPPPPSSGGRSPAPPNLERRNSMERPTRRLSQGQTTFNTSTAPSPRAVSFSQHNQMVSNDGRHELITAFGRGSTPAVSAADSHRLLESPHPPHDGGYHPSGLASRQASHTSGGPGSSSQGTRTPRHINLEKGTPRRGSNGYTGPDSANSSTGVAHALPLLPAKGPASCERPALGSAARRSSGRLSSSELRPGTGDAAGDDWLKGFDRSMI